MFRNVINYNTNPSTPLSTLGNTDQLMVPAMQVYRVIKQSKTMRKATLFRFNAYLNLLANLAHYKKRVYIPVINIKHEKYCEQVVL